MEPLRTAGGVCMDRVFCPLHKLILGGMCVRTFLNPHTFTAIAWTFLRQSSPPPICSHPPSPATCSFHGDRLSGLCCAHQVRGLGDIKINGCGESLGLQNIYHETQAYSFLQMKLQPWMFVECHLISPALLDIASLPQAQ